MDRQFYDPAHREAEKQQSRQRDEADIASSAASASEVQRRNNFLSGFDIPAGKILGWKEFG